MNTDIVQAGRRRPGRPATDGWPNRGDPVAARSGDQAAADRAGVVTALYQAHALGLVRLAHVMLGDAAAAEDVVQEAFCGLYRRWGGLADQGRALQYVRTAVLNGCRSVLRQRRRHGQAGDWPGLAATMNGGTSSAGSPPYGTSLAGGPSPEAAALDGEEARTLLAAVQRLPHRQREAIVLRYYLDMPEAEIAAVMGISPGSVRSAASRALAALAQLLENTR
jgi:RNA polymerase sigma factor (sigma-70 family)